jgi:hypothetical protein
MEKNDPRVGGEVESLKISRLTALAMTRSCAYKSTSMGRD